MGQYYLPTILDGTELIIYNRRVNGEYGMAKLMEHSWINNPTVNKVCSHIYHHPCRIAWVGDYYEIDVPSIPISGSEIWKRCDSEGIELEAQPIKMQGKVLVNHTQKFYIELDKYIKDNTTKDGWCIHPLSLLTACGNGGGGGDYYGCNQENVGEWAGNLISIEDSDSWVNSEKYRVLEYEFQENW